MKRGVNGVLDTGIFVLTGQHGEGGHISTDRLYRFAEGDGYRHNEIYHCTLKSHEPECRVSL